MLQSLEQNVGKAALRVILIGQLFTAVQKNFDKIQMQGIARDHIRAWNGLVIPF